MKNQLCWWLVIVFLFIGILNATTESVSAELSYNIFQQDFDFFQKTLRESHPNIYANLPEPEFNKQVNLIIEELATETDTLHFIAKLKQIPSIL